ncbi:MAG: flagellar basal body-associated FliL family protein [Gemmatimonadaceae bacterium]|nr:flagellar basal body-associated FliL family protein [Gemmatimonadaceae bacterium]
MAEEVSAPDEGAEPKKKSLPAFVLPLVLALVGTGAGGFVGATVVGPKLTVGFTGGLTAADVGAHASAKGGHGEGADSTDEEASAEGAEAKGGGEHADAAPPPLYTISDLVLNPAGSGGTRFLMLSVAFDMKDSAGVEALKQRDAEIKDAVLALVGGKTVDQLSEVSAREPLKVEIRDLVGRITRKPKSIKRVSFPQFVIQ